MIDEEYAKALRHILKDALSQHIFIMEELSEYSKCSRTTIWRFLEEKTNMTYEVAERVGNAYFELVKKHRFESLNCIGRFFL